MTFPRNASRSFSPLLPLSIIIIIILFLTIPPFLEAIENVLEGEFNIVWRANIVRWKAIEDPPRWPQRLRQDRLCQTGPRTRFPSFPTYKYLSPPSNWYLFLTIISSSNVVHQDHIAHPFPTFYFHIIIVDVLSVIYIRRLLQVILYLFIDDPLVTEPTKVTCKDEPLSPGDSFLISHEVSNSVMGEVNPRPEKPFPPRDSPKLELIERTPFFLSLCIETFLPFHRLSPPISFLLSVVAHLHLFSRNFPLGHERYALLQFNGKCSYEISRVLSLEEHASW